MKKGVNIWCFPEGYKIERCMKIAKEASFDGIEINMEEANHQEDDTRLTLDSSEKEILKIRDMAYSIGLEIPSVSTSLSWKVPLSSYDSHTREKGKTLVKKMIDAACILGADTVLLVPGLVDEQNSYKDSYSRSLQALKELAPYAENNKINIGIENVWNKFLMSPLEMRRYIEEIGSSYVGAYFDVGNVVEFSYPEYWIEILGDLIKKIHVKDYMREMGFTELLEGDVNWDKVISALKNAKYDDYLTAELTPYKLYPEILIKQTTMAMDAILA